ncbi:uncharacterized protein J4E79_007247 [Alternaria viburni]|uniref:uncharacterized protein n=1 Tax=Alternaria viburni TaxID=566460 RepID=UPI0020C376C0|nr:uncharacterized protein J4E79_007247 [Alternaria viburni]KAI4658265.1 hypothetical protein J4E79_007247 [Alternaria viburni]
MTSSPAIDVAITSSPDVFDIDGHTDLSIRLSLTLRHDKPITLYKRDTSLFDGKILHDGGLTFTDVETGQLVPRKQHVIHTGFTPLSTSGREKTDPRESWVRSLKFASFKDGQTYRMGISENALVKDWFDGTVWKLLGWQMLGWTPTTVHTHISYRVVESSVVTIKRLKADDDIRLEDVLSVKPTD